MGDSHPMAPGLLGHIDPPFDQERQALQCARPRLQGGGPAAAEGEGTQVPWACPGVIVPGSVFSL